MHLALEPQVSSTNYGRLSLFKDLANRECEIDSVCCDGGMYHVLMQQTEGSAWFSEGQEGTLLKVDDTQVASCPSREPLF